MKQIDEFTKIIKPVSFFSGQSLIVFELQANFNSLLLSNNTQDYFW